MLVVVMLYLKWGIGLNKMKLLYLTLPIFILSILLVNAFPMELLPNGTIIEAGSVNGTPVDFILFNNSLYIIPKINVTSNITNYNVTNYDITNHTNLTCYNCSYNYTYYYNATGNYTYNRTELDSRFVNYITTSSANSQFALKGDLSSYALKTEMEAMNITAVGVQQGIGKTTFWVMIGILFFCIIALCLILMVRD